ncbi:hypothetical protein B0F90DRAFT_1916890 [Multifurca ochricompacta]|uniref:Uncharacterized protein n=1 Tax=Multifurca ochricompacta TaxID=376703 RepID=A0AAD4M6N1_9AGAM|nr:hypothetical protein B0F90DRAFT_1916890 [Multifurca ochricompacta]
MPLASSGLLSSATRQAFRVAHHPPNISSARHLHTQTKKLFNAFVGHLTTPGTLRAPASTSRSTHSVAFRFSAIENKLSLPAQKGSQTAQGALRTRTKVDFHPAATTCATETATQAEFDKYFASRQVPDVSTTLLIPLAPTPTTRVPLTHAFAYDRHPLIPFLELSALHIDTERHAFRVKALFDQLDAAQVWNKGAMCESLGGARGASVLRVYFSGWSAHAVRGILGETATGWCVLEEERAKELEMRSWSRQCQTSALRRTALDWQSST